MEGEEDTRADRPEVMEAMREGEGFDARASQTLREDYSYFCRRFQDGAYYVRIAIPTQSLVDVYLSSFPVVFTFLLLDLAVCLLATYLLTDTVLKPVEKLAMDAARRKRITASCPELETLAALMNRMNDDADRQMKQIADEKELVVKAQQSKNDFIANITHEMNTPLTSIKGFAELLAAGALSGETAQQAAQTILLQSERLTNLVASIINYNEIDSDDLPTYEVNASKIAEELLETLAPAIAERHLTLYTHIEPDVLLMSRQERVTEIFGNLIRNAIRYNRDGGSLTVALTKTQFSVQDTGIGIAEEDRERIFDRFFTVDKSHSGKNGGFGLGLSVVKKLCKKAGWWIGVESEVGKGSTFTVQFSR